MTDDEATKAFLAAGGEVQRLDADAPTQRDREAHEREERRAERRAERAFEARLRRLGRV